MLHAPSQALPFVAIRSRASTAAASSPMLMPATCFSREEHLQYALLQVEPGKPGAEVLKKNYSYKSKKEFAYRMCTG